MLRGGGEGERTGTHSFSLVGVLAAWASSIGSRYGGRVWVLKGGWRGKEAGEGIEKSIGREGVL